MIAEFLDTNILVYAHAGGAGTRHSKAVELIARIAEAEVGALSTQVLSEFYSTVTGKLRMKSQDAEASIRDLSLWILHRPSHSDILSAIEIQRRHRISWWDAMIVNSAIQLGSRILWSEDLNDGQRFGPTTVRNPFA